MNEKIPANLLKMKVLAQVPRSEYTDAPELEDALDEGKRKSFIQRLRLGGKKETKVAMPKPSVQELVFNAAMWLRMSDATEQIVSFFLVYKDQTGEHAILVDEAKIGTEAASVMLTNNVHLKTRGEIEFIKACCSGIHPGQRFFVDELYVQRVRDVQAAPTQLKQA